MRKLFLSAVAAAAFSLGSAQAAPSMVITLTDTEVPALSLTCTISGVVSVLSSCSTGPAFSFSILSGSTEGNFRLGFSGDVGGYSLAGEVSQSNTPGTITQASINMSYTDVRNLTSIGRLVMSVQAYEFTLPAGPDLTIFGSATGTSNNLDPNAPPPMPGQFIEGGFFANASNNVPPQAGATIGLGCDYEVTGVASGDNCSRSGVWTRGAGPFSLQDTVSFQLAQGQDGINGGSNVIVRNRIPEPVSTALVGMGLVGLAFFSRRRKTVMTA